MRYARRAGHDESDREIVMHSDMPNSRRSQSGILRIQALCILGQLADSRARHEHIYCALGEDSVIIMSVHA